MKYCYEEQYNIKHRKSGFWQGKVRQLQGNWKQGKVGLCQVEILNMFKISWSHKMQGKYRKVFKGHIKLQKGQKRV